MSEQNQGKVRIDLQRLSQRVGQFDGYNISGIELRAPDGSVSWKITMWNADEGADYWMAGDEFRMVGTHIFDPSANGWTTYELGPVTEPTGAERKAVETALKFWRENQPSPQSLHGAE